MENVRIGILGLGNMGSHHATYIRRGDVKGGVLAAVCDIKPEKIKWAKETFKDGVSFFDDAEKMFASGEIDAVIVAIPHYFHPPMAIMAFKYNLHALVEKPAGVYTKQVREMNEAAAKSDRVFGIMFNQRTNPLYQKARELVSSGEVGIIKRSNWIITDWYRPQSYYDSGDWRATWAGEGGGVLMNQSPHQLDLWQWICGMPTRIRAFCNEAKFHNIEVEDDVTAYAEYENGATGVFVTSTGDHPGTNRFEILGDRGKIIIEAGKLNFWRLRESERDFNRNTKIAFSAPEVWKCDVPVHGATTEHIGITNNFVNSILTGAPLLASGAEGINGVTLANAMYLSTWTDNWVTLPLDEDLYLEKLQAKIATSSYKKVATNTTNASLEGTF